MTAILLAVLLLAGCATAPANVVTFDRTLFALHFGRLSVHLEDACAAKAPKLDKATCTELRGQAKVIQRVLLTAPPEAAGLDMTMVMELLGTFAGAAK